MWFLLRGRWACRWAYQCAATPIWRLPLPASASETPRTPAETNDRPLLDASFHHLVDDTMVKTLLPEFFSLNPPGTKPGVGSTWYTCRYDDTHPKSNVRSTQPAGCLTRNSANIRVAPAPPRSRHFLLPSPCTEPSARRRPRAEPPAASRRARHASVPRACYP